MNHIQLPSVSNSLSNSTILLQSLIEPLPFADEIQTQSSMNFARSVSFAMLDEHGQNIPLNTTFDHPIEIFIPCDPNLPIPKMSARNVTHQYRLQEIYSIYFEFHSFNGIFRYYLNNNQTLHHRTVVSGIRELNDKENANYGDPLTNHLQTHCLSTRRLT